MGFIVWGIVQAFGGNCADGLWIAFIGWFLYSAAAQTAQSVVVREVLADQGLRDGVCCAKRSSVGAGNQASS